ncbi:usher CupC3 [Pseudomonas sp. GL93]|nr:usher CupC3 [Pseudomonas sp. GL93]
MLSSTATSAAQFNPLFLKNKGAEVDLRYFEKSNGIVPGTYSVDLYLNQQLERRQELFFQAGEEAESSEAQPVLTVALLRELGVNVDRLRQEGIVAPDSADSDPVTLLRIDGASVELDVTKLSLFISIPQAYIQRRGRGYVDPSLWDDGITAFFTNYQLNFNRNTGGFSSDYGYLGLRNGLNIGRWRLRNDSAISQGTGMRRTFSSNRTYLERDITSLKGRIAFGQLYSRGDIFDSSRFRGAQLASDIGMLPDDEAGYAPVVYGIAETNATVEIRQNGYVIYSTTVSPGAFEIRDIYPGGSNGDLHITIIEADGRERKYTQAYSYLPVMTRRGSFQYSLSLGHYDNERSVSPKLLQSTAVYGATDNLTTYGGVLASEGYTALNLGIGINSSLGGMSMDVTSSRSRPDSGKQASGQSARFLYSKTLSSTNTTFSMVGYRYSTSGYRTLSEYIDERGNTDYYFGSRGRPKNRLDLSIRQTIGTYGSFYINGGEVNYWDRSGNTRNVQVGYSGSVGEVSYSLSASHTQSVGRSRQSDNQLAFSMSVPFGPRARSQRFYSNLTSGGKGEDSVQTGVAGYLDGSNTLSYSAQAGRSSGDKSAGVGLGWDGPSAQLAANYSKSGPSRHLDMTASGSVVVHGDGMTFGRSVGETFALVEVPGVAGVALEGSTASTDGAGYTVQSYIQPYRYNWVNIDTQTLGSDVDVTETSQRVVPRRGSIVKARFEASTGRRVQFELLQANGNKLPFGTQLFDENNILLAVVDNRSRALVFGIKDQGLLMLNWSGGKCSAPYKLPERNPLLVYDQVKATCGVQ